MGFIVVSKDGVEGREERTIDDPQEPARCGSSRATRRSTRARATRPQDQNTAIIHYRRADGDYSGWGLHVWDGAATGDRLGLAAAAGRDRLYGVTFKVPLAAGATGLSYIIHKGDTKDLPDDQRLDFATAGREVWLLAGVADRLLPVVSKAGPAG